MSLMERSGFLTRVLLTVSTNSSFSPGLNLRLCREEGGVGEAGDRFFFLLEGGRVAEPSVLESEDGFSVLLLLSGGWLSLRAVWTVGRCGWLLRAGSSRSGKLLLIRTAWNGFTAN